MISFAIPTWNRSEKLRKCIESIAAQKPEQIVIADDASTDDTQKVCMDLAKKYPFIKYLRYEDRQNFSGNYKRAVLGSDAEYTWTFGDDDILVEGALSMIENTVKNTQFDFYHASETIRTVKAEAACGTVFQLSNGLGWLDFTGFISGNIGKTYLMKEGVNSDQWEMYGRSSYPQSLAILETMSGRSAMMMEIGAVESAKFEEGDTGQRWADNQICWRYLYVGDGLRHLVDLGKIPAKVHETFFRYQTGSLFDRLMRDFNGREVLDPGAVKKEDWDCLQYMADMVDGERGEIVSTWVRNVREKIGEEQCHWIESKLAYERLSEVMNTIKFPVFTTAYLP